MKELTELYNGFVDQMEKGLASPEVAAECQIRIVALYPGIATRERDAKKLFKAELAKVASSLDPATNKPMATGKAEIVVKGGPLGLALIDAKAESDLFENFKFTLKDYIDSLNKEWKNS